MRLTKEEQKMLNGEYGATVQKCMKVLVKLGEIYGAECMVEVKSVHSPGVSYRVAGDAGLGYVVDASADAKFKIPCTLNTIGIDEDAWKGIGFDEYFASQQIKLSDAYKKMGAIPCNTCTPYLVGSIPMQGEHVAWGESSAIAFVNSVLGARTNREGGPTALAAAVCGRVPKYGLHLDENRKGTCHIDVQVPLNSDKDYAALGYFVGSVAGQGVPVITGVKERPSIDNFKTLGAAAASAGAVALYHVVGFTPEAPTYEAVVNKELETVVFGQDEYDKVCSKFAQKGDIDFVVIGCPHASILEIEAVAKLLANKKIKTGFWICTARQTKSLADRMGYTKKLTDAGVEIICDTCPVLCQTLSQRNYKTIATNSGKMAHYAPGLWHLQPVLLTLEECVKVALEGKWED